MCKEMLKISKTTETRVIQLEFHPSYQYAIATQCMIVYEYNNYNIPNSKHKSTSIRVWLYLLHYSKFMEIAKKHFGLQKNQS